MLVFLLCFSCLFFLEDDTSAQIQTEEAQERARTFIQKIAEYSIGNPLAPSAMPEWEEAYPGRPMLVHGYSDLKGRYYLVPVKNLDDKVFSLVSIGANDGTWHHYFKFDARESLLEVSRNNAAGILLNEFGIAAPFESITLVMMPNKTLYWYYRMEVMDTIREFFVNSSNSDDIHTEADKAEAGLTGSLDNTYPALEGTHSRNDQKSLTFFYPTSYDISSVPHYYQLNTYLSGPAAIEMVFDFWGPHVYQPDIEHVADTSPSADTDYDNLRRASHFSENSTAIQDPTLQGYHERALGYGSLDNWWSYPDETDPDYPDRYNDLKTLISSDYPILILTWYDDSYSSEHYRVVKGYNDDTNVFIVHDPWYVLPYLGPDVNFNQEFLVDDLWLYSDRWGLHSSPWNVQITSPDTVSPDEHFTVSASIEYRGPHPYEGQDNASDPQATITLTAGFSLDVGETQTKSLPGIGTSNSSDSVSWNVVAPSGESMGTISIESKGYINDSSASYPDYYDWIGVESQVGVQALSTDTDGDGLGDTLDNCPTDDNPDQADNDDDGTGDVCDPDDDNDGYDDAGDCAPFDPQINPAAVELCDDTDNNCDGTIDDNLDIDSDGYMGCGDVDCNDADPDIYPSATEICNGYDDDCDASLDEGCGEICDQQVKYGVDVRVTQSLESSSRTSLVWNEDGYGLFWHDSRPGNYEIYFARLDPDGEKIGSETRVTEAPRNSSYPSGVWTGSEYGVAWHDYRDGNYEIYFARLDASGSKISAERRITRDPAISDYASLIWTGSEYGVAWQEISDADWEIYFARLDSTGKKIGSEVRVTGISRNSTQVSLAWTGSEYGLAWHDSRVGDYEIYFARLDASGTKIGSDVRVTNFLWNSLFPSLVWTGAEYGLSWDESRNFNKEVYFARLDASGTKIGSDVRVTSDSSNSSYSSIAWNGVEYGICWEDHRDGNAEIYFARVDASGNKIGSDVRVTYDDSGSYGNYDRYMVWTGSKYGISFHDNRDGNLEIYTTRVKCCDLALDSDSDTYNECDDCNDNSDVSYPGASEICDGLDNDCDWIVDEGPVPGGTAGLLFQFNKQTMNWGSAVDADRYDVVKGDLMALRSSLGDFTSSLSGCLEDDSIDTEASDSDEPGSGEGFYYLVGAQAVCTNGTYNTGQPGQMGDRDPEIDASAHKCP